MLDSRSKAYLNIIFKYNYPAAGIWLKVTGLAAGYYGDYFEAGDNARLKLNLVR